MINKKPEYWAAAAIFAILCFSLIGGGFVLIITSGITLEDAPDTIKAAASYGAGWASLAFYMGIVSYFRSYGHDKKLEKLEKELSELYGWRDSK